ncbi:MAG: sigma-54 dependent transcriptional regulator [Acidobacteriota bacterium]|nr:sigma-54 dependent transcriptional regulator [Blastocatellia bacterium]MDW8411725.1 sigma-54 dependent transcriptional regulator [Acidobacteriota bacterium]
MARILIVDDESRMREILAIILDGQGYEVEQATDAISALELLEQQPFDLMITDLRMAPLSGIDLLNEIQRRQIKIAVIMITAFGTIESAVEAMKLGACDYLTKPFQRNEILLKVRSAIEKQRLTRRLELYEREFNNLYTVENIIGQSSQMQEVIRTIMLVANSDSSVLITGETGTGKELVARAIHNLSARKKEPFVAINCAALPEQLLESELFGHVKGAFTGATSSRKGLMEEADGGTFFLDEIGSMPLGLQAKLLRALQEKAIRRLGENKTFVLNVRIVSASNEDLLEKIKQHTFRQDLYYRLSVVPIKLPPLRERSGDIPILAEHFLKKFAKRENKQIKGFDKGAMSALEKYSYPGNVRELENIIERAVTLCQSNIITTKELPVELSGETLSAKTLELQEKMLVEQAIKRNIGNLDRAAAELGIGRTTLWRKMKRYNIQKPASPAR